MRVQLAVLLCLGTLCVHPLMTSLSWAELREDQGKPAKPVKKLTNCGSLRHPATHFVLENDVEAAGTCFSIEADDVTLDLNGHTVIYGTAPAGKPTYGVLAADCWYQPIAGNPCGGSHRQPVVENGKIVQGADAAPMSHALRFGQANHLTGITAHHLEITVHSPDSIGIYSEYLPGGSDVYANTIHNNVSVISSRTQFRGASIKLDEEAAAKIPDQIHNNVIVGGAQLGIRDDNPAGSRIFENDISQDATYTNGFCIDAAGAGMQVYRNNCHPVHGRGIHANQSGVQVYDNTVETIDSDQNQEYHGCEINGTYGIQLESDNFAPTGIRIYSNHVKVHAAACAAEAMRLTDLKDAKIEITGNEFVAVQDPLARDASKQAQAPARARALSVGNVDGKGLLFTKNLLRADSAIFHMDWDGGGGFLLRDNTFQAGPGAKEDLVLAEFGNGTGPSQHNYFEDNLYQGIAPDSARFGEFVGKSWYAVTSVFSIRVVDQKGRSVRRAEVKTAMDAGETEAVLTDAEGKAQLVVPLFRVASKEPVKRYSEHRLSVRGEGCEPLQVELKANGPRSFSRTITCH